MTLFHRVLAWLVLAVLGALLAQVLLQDPGYVLVRFRGMDYTTSVAAGIGLLLAGAFALALLWTLLRLPFRAWARHRERQGRARLFEGLLAFERGEPARAERLLAQAADAGDMAAATRALAVRAARLQGNEEAADRHLQALATQHPALRAALQAEHALQAGDAAAALAALDAVDAQPPSPRGLLLRAEALAALGRSWEAHGLLGALRQQQAAAPSALDALQARWAEAALTEAADANALADRWDALQPALRTQPAVVAAYAQRAAAMGWHDAASARLEEALQAQWDAGLVGLYGRLPLARLEQRRARLEAWLQARPSDPALLLATARIAQQQGQWLQADAWLHRAIAQGGDAAAWEALGDGALQLGDEARARQAYANALRSQRGEAVVDLAGRDLRQQIADTAAIEDRDAHGLPRLRE